MVWAAKPTGKRGRQPAYSDAAVHLPDVEGPVRNGAAAEDRVHGELLRLIGLDWDVPHFSTLSRRQKTLAVNIPHRGSRGPWHFLIDSTKIKVEGEGAWNARKHGGPKCRVRCNIHIGVDEETLEVRAVEVTSRDISDAPMPPERLAKNPADQDIASVTADGACDIRKCHDALAERGANAVIPPRKNAKPWKAITGGAVAHNEARASKYLDRALWRRWSRSPPKPRRNQDALREPKDREAKLLGQRRMARASDRHVAEFQVRVVPC